MTLRYRDVLRAARRALAPHSAQGQDYALGLLRRYYPPRAVVQADGDYTYARGDLPCVLVAHTDTVHDEAPSPLYHDARRGALWSPCGLGADDRAGVAAIDLVLASGARPSVLLTDGEETGGHGARAAARALEPDGAHVLIQLDRMHATDYVTYDCHCPPLNEWAASHGWQAATGSYTDICELMPAWGVAGCNVSVGYYGQHTFGEYLLLRQLRATVRRVIGMLRDLPTEPFLYTERPRPTLSFARRPRYDLMWEDRCALCCQALWLPSEKQEGVCILCQERIDYSPELHAADNEDTRNGRAR